MALRFYEKALKSGMVQMPNEEMRELQQASIDDMWEVTTAKYTVLEQDTFGPLTFHEIEVYFDCVVGVTSTFMKNGNDYRKLIFQSIDHECVRGRYYKFDGSYWLVDFTDPMITVQKFVTVRRCNNWLRMIDPENGSIVKWPCVIDYDATSPSLQVGSDIILPNNHLSVIVQGNAETNRLFKLNTRFLIGGRPFKLQAYQNAILPSDEAEQTNILYFDLYLDEEHANDNQQTQIADNGEFNYTVQIEGPDKIDVQVGKTGKLKCSVILNGQEVNRQVEWKSNNPEVITVEKDGSYTVLKSWFKPVTVAVSLQDNSAVTDKIQLNIVNQDAVVSSIDIIPDFDKIRQYEKINFTLKLLVNGVEQSGATSTISLKENEQIVNSRYLRIRNIVENDYVIEATNIAQEIQLLYITMASADGLVSETKVVPIEVVSMMG